jgi:uncharacterized membrane protein YdbT with pleckstrin-like domain
MGFTRDQLLAGETLVILTHQHALVLAKPILLNALVLTVLSGICLWLQDHYWILALCLIPLAFLLWKFLERNRKEYIVTDRRVVKQQGVFSVRSYDAPLDKINNVFHEQTILGRMFNYGNVGLETASEQGTTVFHFIPDPVGFKNSVVRQREQYKGPAAAAYAAPVQDIRRVLEDLASLRDRRIITPAEFEAKKKSLLEQL